MVQRSIGILTNNGFIVVEALKLVSESEMEKLNLPLVISRELKEKTKQVKINAAPNKDQIETESWNEPPAGSVPESQKILTASITPIVPNSNNAIQTEPIGQLTFANDMLVLDSIKCLNEKGWLGSLECSCRRWTKILFRHSFIFEKLSKTREELC